MPLFNMTEREFGQAVDDYNDKLLNEYLDPKPKNDDAEYEDYLDRLGFLD